MAYLLYSVIFLTGAVFGSFFLLISDRSCSSQYHARLSALLFDRSHCEYCGTTLKASDLIPLLSYLRERGKCRYCNSTLSIRYLLAEITGGITALTLFIHLGINPDSASLFFIISCALFITYTDIRKMIIPDIYLIIMLISTGVYSLFRGVSLDNVYGMLFLGGLFLLILFIFPGAFGGGDVKYGALIGLLCGFSLSVVVLETALISGSIFGITYAAVSGKGMRIKIPFGPFLTAGLFTALLWGTDILIMYHSFFLE